MISKTETDSITCPNCSSTNIWKSGIKKNKYNSFQQYQCKPCKKIFTNGESRNKTHPTNIILAALSLYNLGHPQTEITNMISKKFKIKPSQKTISNWIKEYKPLLSFHKLRKQSINYIKHQGIPKQDIPSTIIDKYEFLHNNLPYQFQLHNAKLHLLFKNKLYNNEFTNLSKYYEPIKQYLNKIPTKQFPHHIFNTYNPNKYNQQKHQAPQDLQDAASSDADIARIKNINAKNNQESRASQLKFTHLKITHLSKTNQANKLASLALNLSKSNKDRHKVIQDFFITNDSTTIATEIPIYLTKDDINYFKRKGFSINLTNTPITGHIDILQIRNGLIHILDYKPEAKTTNPIQQLIIYALALASRTKLDLKSIKAAWLDENNYFEFFPLHAVYEK